MDNTDARLPSRIWVEALVRRAQVAGAAAFIVQRTMMRDTDLWVIEIEDPAGRHFITEVVEGDAKEMQPDHSDVFKRRL